MTRFRSFAVILPTFPENHPCFSVLHTLKMRNTLAVILACGLASVLQAHTIRRSYDKSPEETRSFGEFYDKREAQQRLWTTPADTQLLVASPQVYLTIPVQHSYLPHSYMPGYYVSTYPVNQVVPSPSVQYSIQTPAQPVQFVPAPNAPNTDGSAANVEDSSKVSKAVVLRDDLPLVEEQSDKDVDEATLDYLN